METGNSLVVGLTGGVASGKSLVEEAFRELGVPVVDADRVARQVVEPGQPALDAIREAFGAGVITADGALDRRRMREIVFGDEAQLRRLEGITHPAIRHRLLEWRDGLVAPYGVLSAAIMVESSLGSLADRLLVVDVPESVQMLRLMQRDDIPETLARQMMAAQADRADRLARADDVLRNDGTPERTQALVERLHRHYLAIAAGQADAAPGLRLP